MVNKLNLCLVAVSRLRQASRNAVTFMRGEHCEQQHTWGATARHAIAETAQQLRQSPLPPHPQLGDSLMASMRGLRHGKEQPQAGSCAMQAVDWGFAALHTAGAAASITAFPPSCTLFARKIAAEGVSLWLQLMQPLLLE